MLEIKVEFILLLIPYFAGWEHEVQYDYYAHPNSNLYFGKGFWVFFFFFKKNCKPLGVFGRGAVLYVSIPSEECPSLILV